jgi:hypothetical protein
MEDKNKNKPSRNQSIFQQMTSEQRRDFHSPEAQRQRNADRRASKSQGQVYDISLRWKQQNNQEGIATATNDTFGNDEFTLANDATQSSTGTLVQFDVVDENNEPAVYEWVATEVVE